MQKRIEKGGLSISENLYELIEKETLPGTGVDADNFWRELDTTVHDHPVLEGL